MMKNMFKTFFTKEYKDFDTNYLVLNKQILKSLQLTLSFFLILFMVSIYPFRTMPLQHYIYYPVFLIGNNLISCCLLRRAKYQRFITLYICCLQMIIPAFCLEIALALVGNIYSVSSVRALFIGLQVGLIYSVSFLILSSSITKFIMGLFFLAHIIFKQYHLGSESIYVSTAVVAGVLAYINYIYYRKEMLNLSIWNELNRSNEGLKHFEKLIQIFPNQIVFVDKPSLERDSALYFNTDAQRLREDILSKGNKSLSQFLERFDVIEGHEDEPAPLLRCNRSLKAIVTEVFYRKGFAEGNDKEFCTFISTLKQDKPGTIITSHDLEIVMSSNRELHKQSSGYKWEIKIGWIEWEQKDALIIIFNDISKTERIRELKRLDENKDKLLATVSHELRTPLNGIIGMIDVACDEIFENPQKVKSYMEIACKSAKNLLFMINDILDISQIRKGNLRLTLEWTNLQEVFEKILPLIAVQVKAKNLEFLFENRCPHGTRVLADPIRLQQILMNLLGNASKFTSSGFVKLTATLLKKHEPSTRLRLSKDKIDCSSEIFEINEEDSGLIDQSELSLPEFVELCVEDSGKGIQEEEIGNLFQLFGKIETEGNTTGVGLGLAISQSLARKMQSKGIEVESVYGKGSRFFFSLKASRHSNYSLQRQNKSIPEENPFVQELRQLKSSRSSQPSSASQEHSPAVRVLVVDDDQINHLVISLYLNALTIKVLPDKAFNGEEAVNIVESNAKKGQFFNIIFMDCDMPVMNGFQASSKLKVLMRGGALPEVKIIALTANASLADKEYCLQQGMDDVWTKPISRNDFIKKFMDIAGGSKIN